MSRQKSEMIMFLSLKGHEHAHYQQEKFSLSFTRFLDH